MFFRYQAVLPALFIRTLEDHEIASNPLITTMTGKSQTTILPVGTPSGLWNHQADLGTVSRFVIQMYHT